VSIAESFFDEAFDHLSELERGLMDLDTDPDVVGCVFRAAHSIKGGAGACGFQALATFTHRLENVLSRVRSGAEPTTPELTDLLLRATDVLRDFLEGSSPSGEVVPAGAAEVQAELARQADRRGPPTGGGAGSRPCEETGRGWDVSLVPDPDMVMAACVDPLLILDRLRDVGTVEPCCDASHVPPLEELDPLLVYLRWTLRVWTEADEEAIRDILDWSNDAATWTLAEVAPPSAGGGGAGPEREARAKPRASLRVDAAKIDAVLDLVGELVTTNARLRDQAEELTGVERQGIGDALDQLEEQTRSLQNTVLAMRMVPTRTVFESLPRVVRDTARAVGKEVEITVDGEWTEVDREVVQLLVDPLIHMVRNAVDHGLELPDEREARGKPRHGTVAISAAHDRGDVVVTVRDDGRGVDRSRLQRKAEELGLVAPDESVTESILLTAGFSTAREVTDVSGRGVGLDVVNRNVESLGGSLSIESELGRGTSFEIRLPLTLAILDGQLVTVGEEFYVIPVRSIIECLQPDPDALRRIPGAGWVYQLRDVQIPVASLREVFGVPGDPVALGTSFFVVVEVGRAPLALAVDSVGAQQQIVLKQLERNYRHVPGIAGATILGSGRIALVTDPGGLSRVTRAP